jgi:CRISPR/Cas system-associated exonuclease Cas4 (RecB family)
VIHISLKPSIEKKNKKKQWLSPTSINAYLRCPRKFYLSKIEKRKQKPSIHLIRGIAVHSTIEKFYKHKINRCRNMDYSDLRQIVLDLFRDEWESRGSDLIELKLQVDELDFFYTQSEKMMINFLGEFICSHGFEKPDPIVEKTLFSHKFKLLARLDKIDRARSPPIITDFKTSKSKEITEDTKRQMGICSILYEEVFKTKPYLIVHFLNFRSGKMAVQINDDYKRYLREQIANIHHKTQSKDINNYPCTCGWCNKDFKKAKI